MSLWDTLTSPRALSRDTWQWDGTRFRRRTYGDGVAQARHAAAGLRKRGVRPGSVVAMVITNGPDAITCVGGAWFAGASVASLPIISRGMSVAAYTAQLRQLCALLGVDFLVAEDRFLTFITADTDPGVEVVGCSSLIETADAGEIAPPHPKDTMFIQFSSGTTGAPHGVELNGVAIAAHLDALSARADIDPERDTGASWLPLSHDMGFFGCFMLGWYNGVPGVIGTPERFLSAPRTWFDDCAEAGATITAAAPFALDIAARVERLRSNGKPLKLRLCLVGAEEIPWATLADAATVFAPRGLTLEALTPAYGLAEATLGVTAEPLQASPSFVDVDGQALAEGDVELVEPDHPRARRLVSTGEPLRGVGVRIDPANGEILVKSPGLTSGYFGDEQRTAERLRDGELRTGDIGFLHNGKLFVSGRNDDLLTTNGRSIYVQQIEQQLGADTDVSAGNCAIVDVRGLDRPRIALVAEVNAQRVDAEAVAKRLYRRIKEDSGLSIRDFVFIDRGLFPKTPSGKVQRYRCRELATDPKVGLRVTLGVDA